MPLNQLSLSTNPFSSPLRTNERFQQLKPPVKLISGIKHVQGHQIGKRVTDLHASNGQGLLQNHETKFEAVSVEDERRSGNYKPNIWNYEFVESLTNEYNYREDGRVKKLKKDFMHVFDQAADVTKLQLIESINRLGLSLVFEKDIEDALDVIGSNIKSFSGVQARALCFRLLRQYGHDISQDIFVDSVDEINALKQGRSADIKGMLELFEASHLAFEGEHIMTEAKALSHRDVKEVHSNVKDNIAKQVADALELPLHWRVQWFEMRQQIDAYEQEVERNPVLLELAKLNFNMIQAVHQEDLRQLSMWWRDLGLIKNISFSRDRLVESFLWGVGIAYEPHHSCMRKCLTKVITMILIIDDLYDIYGSLEELECFTRALDRWDAKEIQDLPESLKACFSALDSITNEVALDIQKEQCLNEPVLPYLRKAWADVCKTFLVEARWYNARYTPSLDEYLKNAWFSSTGPLLSVIIVLLAQHGSRNELIDAWERAQELVYCSSLIFRLCNDLGTSEVELQRGDSHSSILCHMRDANVLEETAREHINDMIVSTWKRINKELLLSRQVPMLQASANHIINIARLSHFFYYDGDGMSNQDRETKELVKLLFVEPVPVNSSSYAASVANVY